MSEILKAYHPSPIGLVEVTGNPDGIASVHFVEDQPYLPDIPDCLQDCIKQLTEFFQGNRQDFSLKLNPQGTAFQQKVWAALLNIPYGRTATYLDIALALGDKNAVRAVGSANGRNPISVIVPCHRVIGANGKLIGYGGGIWRKEWLLRHEGAILA